MEHLLQIGLSNAGTAALLAILAALVTRLWRNPHFAHALWLLVLLRLVAPPVFAIPVHLPERLFAQRMLSSASPPTDSSSADELDVSWNDHHPAFSSPIPVRAPIGSSAKAETARSRSVETNPPPTATVPLRLIAKPITVANVLAVLWLGGTVLYVMMVGSRVARFARAMRRIRGDAPANLRDEVASVARSIGLRRAPRMEVIEGSLSPMVWSGWRPVLLLPRTFIESLDPSKRRLLLLHELLHVRRGDHRLRWFTIGILAIYWWNPFAWWAVRRLQVAEEECCDAAVLFHFPQQSAAYSETLLAVSDFVSCGRLPAPALSIGVERKNHLKRRMLMILDGPQWARLSKTQLAVLLSCGIAVLAVTWKSATAQVESTTPAKPAATVEPKRAPDSIARSHLVRPQPTMSPAIVKAGGEVSTVPPMDGTALRRRNRFLDDTPLKVAPGDDEAQRLLKERYNAAVHSLKLTNNQYELGLSNMATLLAAGRSVLDAKLALAKTPDEALSVREDYLEIANACWREAKAKLEIGGVVGFSPAEESQAREAVFDARLKLLELKSSERGKTSKKESATARPDQGLRHTLDSRPLTLPEIVNVPKTSPPIDKAQAAKLNRFLDVTPLKIAPDEDEARKLAKERHNAAVRSMFFLYAQYQLGTTAMANALAAGRSALDAKLALATTPDEKLRVREEYLAFADACWRMAKTKLDIGGITGFSPVDESQAREAALDAKLKLLELKSGQQGGKTSGQAAAKTESLPTLLTVKPLEPTSTEAELQTLLRQRYNAALKALQGQYQRVLIDSALPMGYLSLATLGRTLVDAELAMAKTSDVVPVYERYLQLTKFFENRTQALWKAGQISRAEVDAAHEARLDAEIKLLQVKRKPAAGPNGL